MSSGSPSPGRASSLAPPNSFLSAYLQDWNC